MSILNKLCRFLEIYRERKIKENFPVTLYKFLNQNSLNLGYIFRYSFFISLKFRALGQGRKNGQIFMSQTNNYHKILK